jgi:hypothetical protein
MDVTAPVNELYLPDFVEGMELMSNEYDTQGPISIGTYYSR